MTGRREFTFRQHVDVAELKDALKRERTPEEMAEKNLSYGVDHWIRICVRDGLGDDPYINELHWRYLHRPVSREYLEK